MTDILFHTYHAMKDPRLEAAWREMEEKDGSLSPFLYFDYLRNIFRYTSRWAWMWSPEIVCAESSDGEILMIAPLKRNRCSGTVKMLGEIKGCGRTDFLFREGLADETKDECIRLLIGRQDANLKLRRIDEHSPLNTYFAGCGMNVKQYEWECVRLDITGDVEMHIKRLSPSVRQNLRTAYNRMKRDDVNYELRVYMPGDVMDIDVWNDVIRLYLHRFLGKYKKGKSRNPLYKLYKTVFYKYIKHDTVSLRRLGNTFHSVLFMNGEIACFMSGFSNHGRTSVVIPWLAFNDRYRFYSPGYIMICETMKWLSRNSMIREIDLSRGVEKYKTDLGGEIYTTKSYSLDRRHGVASKKL